MPIELQAPRILTTELPPTSRSIMGVSTCTYALLGIFEKGPIGVPTFVAGLPEAHRLFGRPIAQGKSMHALQLYFAQGGQKAYVVRTAHYKDPAKPHTLTAQTAHVTILDNNPNVGKQATATITIQTEPEKGDTVTINGVTFTCGKNWDVPPKELTSEIKENESSIEVETSKLPFSLKKPQQAALALKEALNNCKDKKISGLLTAQVSPKNPAQLILTTIPVGKSHNSIKLASSKNKTCILSGKTLTGGLDSQAKPCLKIEAANGVGTHANGCIIRIEKNHNNIGFSLAVIQDDQVLDRFDHLSLDPNSDNFIQSRINKKGARLITVHVQDSSSNLLTPTLGEHTLHGGDDGLNDLNDADFIGDDTSCTGLYSLKSIDKQFALASIPDRTTATFQKTALQFAQKQQHFLYLLDLPPHLTPQEAVQYKRKHHLYSEYTAMFYPHVYCLQPSEVTALLPNSAAIAGLMARTDAVPGKGVAKAAAGIEDGRLWGLQGLEHAATQQQTVRDLLYKEGINPLWVQPGVGIINDGSHLSQLDGFVRFFNERRVLLFLRCSLQEGQGGPAERAARRLRRSC